MQRIRSEDGRLVEIFEMADTSGTMTDASGTAVTASTAVTILAANVDREYLFIQNNNASSAMWINFGTDAMLSQPSIFIPARGIFKMSRGDGFISTESVSLISGTANHDYTLKWA